MPGSTARAPRQLLPAKRRRVSLLDLTLDQVEACEERIGLSVRKWDDAPSQARVMRVVYSIAYEVPIEEVGHMSLRELQASVDLTGDGGDPDSSGPTLPNE